MSSFSIVIPVYNQITFLRDAIWSVLAQHVASIEILVVDDGSEAIVAEEVKLICAESAHNVTLFRLDHNKGVSAARNFGVARATTDYVIFLDADDILADGYLSQCADYLADGSVDVLMSKTSLISVGVSSDTFRKAQASYDWLTERFHSSDIHSSAYFIAYCPAIHSLVFKREVFEQYSFDEELTYGEDRYLLLQLRQGQLRFATTQLTSGFYRIDDHARHVIPSKLKYLRTALDSMYLPDGFGRSYSYLLQAYYFLKIGQVGQALLAFAKGLRSPSVVFFFAKVTFKRLF